MKPQSALAIYLLFWTITLFAVLPFGVKTSDEAGGDSIPGQATSAPANPMILKKLAWEKINLVNMICTHTELTVLLEQRHTGAAIAVLSRLVAH